MSDSVPDWITNEFLTQTLRKEEGKENVIVTNFTATGAVPPGNNYGSTVIRLKVEYKNSLNNDESNCLSLILKAELTQGPVKELFNLESGEPSFYYKFIPEAKQLMDLSFLPKTYHSPRPKNVILEDLKESGYLMADRTKQLDFEHCRLYMISAAKLHAVSVAVYKQHPELVNDVRQEKLYSDGVESSEMFKLTIKYSMETLVNETNKIERFRKYGEVIKKSIPHLWNAMVEVHQPQHEGLNTINQGDPWTTNMMFKYDEQGKVSDIKLLDFQCLRYASPVHDIVFFIWTSANDNVKKHQLDELYQIYLTNLNEKLEQLNCSERLTYDEFMEIVKKSSPEALYWAGIPIIIDADPLDFGMFQRHKESGNGEELKAYFKKVYRNCAGRFPDIMESLELNGVFDYLSTL